jgi:transposase
MLHAGLDLSRRRLDVCLLSDHAEVVEQTAAPPDADGLRGLVGRAARYRQPVRAVIESMNGARFVHDTLEELGWEVLGADAQKVKGLAPLACKTDKIDARVLAVLSQRDLVPAIWLPDPSIRRERELARFRLHLVRHRTTLKNRIHATLITFGHPCSVSDLFGLAGRDLLDRLQIPDPWRRNVDVALEVIDDLEHALLHRDETQRYPLAAAVGKSDATRRSTRRSRSVREAGAGGLLASRKRRHHCRDLRRRVETRWRVTPKPSAIWSIVSPSAYSARASARRTLAPLMSSAVELSVTNCTSSGPSLVATISAYDAPFARKRRS